MRFSSSSSTRGYLVQGAHGGGGGGDHVVHEEEEGVLRPQADPLADEEVELADGEIRGNQVLLLVQVADPGLGALLHDDGDTVGVLPPDLLPLGPPLLEGVLLLLPLHGVGGLCVLLAAAAGTDC